LPELNALAYLVPLSLTIKTYMAKYYFCVRKPKKENYYFSMRLISRYIPTVPSQPHSAQSARRPFVAPTGPFLL
jgi:hypothetical protein